MDNLKYAPIVNLIVFNLLKIFYLRDLQGRMSRNSKVVFNLGIVNS